MAKKKTSKALAVGAGVAALAATAAGIYMLTGKQGKKNRKVVGKWVDDIQDDIIQELGNVNNITKTTYHKIVDTAAKNYKGLKNVSTSELTAVAKELKNSWATISAELNAASKTMKRVVPKAAKTIAKTATKAAKKVTKRAASKKKATRKTRK